MPTLPETKYTQDGDVSLAYQIVGTGPIDLVLVPGFVSHLEHGWEEPAYARFLQRLASFCRLILFDKRGTGLSDRIAGTPTLEQRMDDVQIVMDSVGCQRAALLGVSEGASIAALFAATYPERTSSLIFYGGLAMKAWAPDHSWGMKPEEAEIDNEMWRREWGGPVGLEYFAPSVAKDERFRLWWAKFLRLSASPSAVIANRRMSIEIDIRSILPTLHVPTLVLQRSGDRLISIEEGRYVAKHIPGAKLVELKGTDHFWWVGDSESIVNEIQFFLTGERQALEPDRMLATLLFTDIVDSTKRAAEIGDRRWIDLLDSHDTLMRQEIARFRGRTVKTTGDGFLATFDGPARAINCALALRDDAQKLGIEIRVGLHTGEIELMEHDVGGIAVHLAARVMAQAQANEVWLSRTVKDLVVGSGFEFSERGVFNLKGIPGEWQLFVVQP
jgi:class 3 adenylate cyclase/pimeloyl-ACP methyl ester carboxylesterase